MLIKSRILCFTLFVSVISFDVMLIIHPEPLIDKIYLQAIRGQAQAQFELADQIETADRNDINLNDQQSSFKKMLNWVIQPFIYAEPKAEDSFDQFFQPIQISQAEALQWYKKAANQDHTHAQIRLATYYYNNGQGPDFQSAYHWIWRLAQKNDAFAQAQLGWMYVQGAGVEKDYQIAHYWFLKSALQGNHQAAPFLAWMYFHAQGVRGSNTEAFKWYKKSAEAGDPEAQMFMVVMYKFGISTAVDLTQSAYWKQKIINTQDIDFEYSYTRNDYENRIKYWAKKNDKQPNQDRDHTFYEKYNLALDYKTASQGNEKRAFEIFNELLKTNESADVLYQLAEMYEKGLGTAQDMKKAIEFYEIAATQNDIMALLRLGDLYFQGNEFVAQNYSKALYWYKKIEALGQPHASMKLGEMYMNGLGVAQDPEQAFQYYLYYADKGDQKALKIIAHCYEYGIGTPQNLKKAQEIKAKLRI